jgi:hypothetical protein
MHGILQVNNWRETCEASYSRHFSNQDCGNIVAQLDVVKSVIELTGHYHLKWLELFDYLTYNFSRHQSCIKRTLHSPWHCETLAGFRYCQFRANLLNNKVPKSKLI